MTGAAKRKAEEDCSDERSIPANSIEGRQGDGDATIRTHQHYRSIID